MSKSYGFIEITGVVAAMDALDIMCKTAARPPPLIQCTEHRLRHR